MHTTFVSLLLAGGLVHWAAAQNLGFETPQTGWTLAAEGAGWQQGEALRGEYCLALEATTDQTAWAVSEPLSGFTPGEPAQVSLALRRLSGDGQLALSLTKEPSKPDPPELWRGVPSKDTRWHRLTLRLMTGLKQPCLALGAVGGAGRWLVDDIRLRSVRVAPVTRPVKRALLPTYAPDLEQGWDASIGDDLRTRTIMGAESVYIQTGSLELYPPSEVTLRRGQRRGLDVDVLSKTAAEKTLRIDVSGPTGWRCETWERKFKGAGAVTVNLPIQAPLAGDADVRLAFDVAGDVKRMRLRVRSERYYPALGVMWRPSESAGIDLSPFNRMPAQFHQLLLGNQPYAEQAAKLAATGADLALSWTCSAAEALDGLARIPRGASPAASGLSGEAHDATHATEFSAAVRTLDKDAVVLSRPFRLQATQAGLEAGPRLREALESGLSGRADALTVQLPPLPGSAVLRELVDNRLPKGPMGSWLNLDRGRDMGALRGLLNAKQAYLPFFAQGVGGHTTGNEGLDALLMARAIIHIFAMGANGITVPAVARDASEIAFISPDGKPNESLLRVYGELTRELAGVRSLAPPAASEVAGYEPGKPITFRHFLRGNEGIIAMWNNSQEAQDVAVDVRARPLQLRLLRLSHPGELCQREYVASFEWDALARHWGHPAVYVTLKPLQIVVLSLNLRGATKTWLREVGPKPPQPAKYDPMGMKEFDERVWGPAR